MSDQTVSSRLVRFAQLVNGGTLDAEAARQAGYSPAYVKTSLARIVARARQDGLIVDPELVRADAVALADVAHTAATLFGLTVRDAADTIVGIASGAEPASGDQLKAAMYIVNQVIGAPKQATDVTTGGQPLTGWVVRQVVATLPADEDDGAAPVA